LGKKSHEEVMQAITDYDIFSLPSYNEGFGIVYVEAMSQGVPVIGVKGQGIEDVIKDGYNGFLAEPQNVNSLIGILDILIGDNEKRKMIGLNGRNTVIRDFTWDANAKKVKKLYEDLVQMKK
jgi:glycosyltransferase involved in cell wall biosynthesis